MAKRKDTDSEEHQPDVSQSRKMLQEVSTFQKACGSISARLHAVHLPTACKRLTVFIPHVFVTQAAAVSEAPEMSSSTPDGAKRQSHDLDELFGNLRRQKSAPSAEEDSGSDQDEEPSEEPEQQRKGKRKGEVEDLFAKLKKHRAVKADKQVKVSDSTSKYLDLEDSLQKEPQHTAVRVRNEAHSAAGRAVCT